ncbi:DUF983 domain-containing protein [Flavobacterium alkalisoli]|uniref:DUF983 domain-containing protein n=1 Tax=Flavobacterium alkalisoli TaxID=2602769 RepID=UPI003A8CAC8A
MSKFTDIVEEKCPKCGQGKVFKSKGSLFLFRLPKMNEHCEVCDHKFLREPGYFFGAMYVSYGLTVAEMIGVYAIAHFFIKDFGYMLALIAFMAVALSMFNFRLSRMLWIYMFDSKEEKKEQV